MGFRVGWRARIRRQMMARPGRSYAAALTSFTLTALLIPAGLLALFEASVWAWIAGLLLSLTPP